MEIRGKERPVQSRLLPGFFALLVLCIGQAGVRAQAIHSYTVKNGRMYISLGANLSGPGLDSFIAQYNLDGIGLHQFTKTGSMDSLKELGWKLELHEPNISVISKPLLSFDNINNPARQMLLTEMHPRTTDLFPAVNNGIAYGYNRFRRKFPFAQRNGTVTVFLRNNTWAKKVMLAGSFNDWSPNGLAMTRTDSGWIAYLNLGPGKYWYKFIADGNWMVDDDNLLRENDGFGNTNSVFYVTNTVFFLNGFAHARKVSLAGSFNDWRADQLQMTRTDQGWALPLYLAEGTHIYRFVVDGNWMADPGNKERLPNEFHDYNSVIRLGKPHLFVLTGFTGAGQVILSGSFNRWGQHELLMDKTTTGWQLLYTLGPGNYEYRFLVDGTWVIDPENPLVANKEGRIKNSYLIIGPNYTFHLKGYPGARSIYLSGDFVGWSPSTLSMKHNGDEWVCSVHLSAGKHLYKFIVDGQWIRDPGNELWEQNEVGTGNSIVWMGK